MAGQALQCCRKRVHGVKKNKGWHQELIASSHKVNVIDDFQGKLPHSGVESIFIDKITRLGPEDAGRTFLRKVHICVPSYRHHIPNQNLHHFNLSTNKYTYNFT